MPISFQCSHCGHRGEADEKYAGMTGPCPKCGQPMHIPQAAPNFGPAPNRGAATSAPPAAIGMPKETGARAQSGNKTLLWVLLGVGGFVVLLCGGAVTAIVLPGIARVRESSRRVNDMVSGRELVVGIMNQESANRRFPPAYKADPKGKPLLSWRVMILPWIEQDSLFKQFKLDEPWDSPHNKQLLEKMPDVFRSRQSKAPPGYANWLAVRGPGCFLSPQGKGNLINEIPDGLTNTAMIVLVDDSRAVEWTRPDDFDYDLQDPTKGLGKLYPGEFLAVMGDGIALRIPMKTDPEQIRRAFNGRDGQPVNLFP